MIRFQNPDLNPGFRSKISTIATPGFQHLQICHLVRLLQTVRLLETLGM